VTVTGGRLGGRRAVAVLAVLTLAALIGGITTAIVRQPGSHHDRVAAAVTTPAPRGSPTTSAPTGTGVVAAAATAVAYYTALRDNDVRTAYGLLCASRRVPYGEYTAEYAADVRTGTGIAQFRRTGGGEVRGDQAAVPATVALADGERTPIIVLLVIEGGQWRVCSSNLGGVLPAPGSSPGPTGSPGSRT
jgi:hypothetical protein